LSETHNHDNRNAAITILCTIAIILFLVFYPVNCNCSSCNGKSEVIKNVGVNFYDPNHLVQNQTVMPISITDSDVLALWLTDGSGNMVGTNTTFDGTHAYHQVTWMNLVDGATYTLHMVSYLPTYGLGYGSMTESVQGCVNTYNNYIDVPRPTLQE
jgi:hypothetical protein